MNKPHIYEIHVEGLLSDTWSDWLEGLAVRSQSGDVTIIHGLLPDQAAMLGVLAKIHTLNLAINTVQKVLSDSHED